MLRDAAAVWLAIVIAAGAGSSTLAPADRARVDRASEVSAQRLNEWLGPASGTSPSIDLQRPWWPSPSSMELESQVAFAMAKARFSRIHDAGPLVDGLAWHLQSRIVEELFDYAYAQPGHHALHASMFGTQVQWGLPVLIVPRPARDLRAPVAIQHGAAAVATLEGVVGWPALAAALRVVASDPRPSLDLAAVRATLESALAVPLDWFFASLDPGVAIDYSIESVSVDGNRTSLALRRSGPAVVPAGVEILVEAGGEQRSTMTWNGAAPAETLVIESGLAPIAITVDPDHHVPLDENVLNQQWRAAGETKRPIKAFASWLVWLQNAMLTYGVLA